MAKVGIGDVAKAAGVSEATVSRVINNRGVVAPETRRVVEDAMRAVGYSRVSLGNLVLLLTPGLEDPFFAKLADRMSAALGLQGYRAVIASAPVGGTQELDYVSAMADAGVLATVFISASNTLADVDPAAYRLLAQRRIPFICIDGPVAGTNAPTLSTNDLLAAELAVDHLWNLGHRRLGLIAGPIGNRPSDLRVQGFLATVEARGGSRDDAVVIRHEYSIEGGTSATGKLLEAGVTGIVAASDEMALGAIRAVRRAGLEVPRDVSVVGYDDAFPLEFLDPPLTTVRQPMERLAQAVVPVLTRLVQGRPVDTSELLFDPELIVRGSTAPPPP
ncbi:LacI family DNA-binding transcriptional regulator [Jiangella aurantiaca]|uniref:LacI family DNA-binding transcriptional regulator n=1 Tax=Jiangella aurantiaca TaxID=2530373 RepID=A0A4V2YST4_9ACTN|nr:LacI family DNA-binding transcriptional regulator [Jiangella aurantiaca]TDD71217.1 LacI family DNA-binding transcriptional regulator [Jiangella aurantiaca]